MVLLQEEDKETIEFISNFKTIKILAQKKRLWKCQLKV